MKTVVKAGLIAALALSMLPAASAAKLTTPRSFDLPEGFTPAPQNMTIAALGIGSVNSIGALDSWVVSDYSVDEYTTYPFWCTYEDLYAGGYFYSAKAKSTTASIQVKTQSGQTVVTDSYSGVPDEASISGIYFELGYLPAGAYKVIFKFKQGDKIVGQTYWIAVVDCGTE